MIICSSSSGGQLITTSIAGECAARTGAGKVRAGTCNKNSTPTNIYTVTAIYHRPPLGGLTMS
jgi:hypothetical protein